MATPLSEVISYLSYDDVLPVGASFETIKVLLQEFGSMSILFTTNHSVSLNLFFSNDGIDFDYDTFYSLSPGSTTITSVILGKWCKLGIVNASRFDATIKFSTYCQVIPCAVQAQVQSSGNTLPSVNVDNFSTSLNNELRIATRKEIKTTNFNYYRSIAGLLLGPNRTLTQVHSGTLTTSPAEMIGNTCTLSNIYTQPAGTYHFIQDNPVVLLNGNSAYIEMICGFWNNGYTNGDVLGYDMMLNGMGYIDTSTGAIVDGAYVGYPENPVPPNTIVDEICLVLYLDGVEVAIPKSQWLFDRLDGKGPSGVVLDPETLGNWRIRASLSTSVYLEFHQPLDNEWIPCHREQAENIFSTTLVQIPSFGFNSYTKRTSTATGTGVTNGCGPMSAQGSIGVEVGTQSLFGLESYNIYASAAYLAGVETEIISIRNGTVFNTLNNRSVIDFDDVTASHIATVTAAPATIRLYKNGTFAGAVWTPKSATYEPTETDSGKWNTGTGYSQAAFLLGNTGTSSFFDLNTLNSELARGETMTFTITCATSGTAYLVVNYRVYI